MLFDDNWLDNTVCMLALILCNNNNEILAWKMYSKQAKILFALGLIQLQKI
jgi:hypothetical protein